MIFLSHTLNKNTPTYGNRNKFVIEKKSDISKGDVANDSTMNTTVHIGTHIDMPYHFYEEGQTLLDFDDDFWKFINPLFIEIEPNSLIIHDELIKKLEVRDKKDYDILIVKTNIEKYRNTDRFWSTNYGFHPDIYQYLKNNYPSLRVIGFDSISVSSFKDRTLGREAHREFLNPKAPILLLEDMKLKDVDESSSFKMIVIAPLRIEDCDGLPCTVLGFLDD